MCLEIQLQQLAFLCPVALQPDKTGKVSTEKLRATIKVRGMQHSAAAASVTHHC